MTYEWVSEWMNWIEFGWWKLQLNENATEKATNTTKALHEIIYKPTNVRKQTLKYHISTLNEEK